jgi:tetratricopeptide (TPR) repeat protein
MRSANGRNVGRRTLIWSLSGLLPLLFLPVSLAAQPQSASALVRQGADLMERGDLPRALEAFEEAARLQPSDPAIQFNVGLTLYTMGRYRQALAPLEKALAHPPSASRARFLRGTVFFQAGEHEACVREVESLRTDPNQGEEVLFMLTESYRSLGRTKEAQDAFGELNRLYPDSAFLHRLMGMAYDARSEYPKALEEFRAALRVRPGMPEIAFAIGYIHWKLRQYEEARAWLSKELATQPCYARAHHYLAEMEREAFRLKEAAQSYRKALDCDPALYDSWLGLGLVIEQEGRWDEALGVYRRLVDLRPQEPQPHFKLATALMKSGKREEAQAELDKAKKLLAEQQERDRRRVGGP